MKVKLNQLKAEGVVIEGLEIEGNMAEYIKVASEVNTQAIKNLSSLFSVLQSGSRMLRSEWQEWEKVEDKDEIAC